ncbi:MAG: type-F conjugative transfer system pilin assembly protein TrbC [Pseudomonadota bacterium]|nr:type-F conjugative transfer system pilin assembly protein TrbC [Pseudomonadota bacterium]MDP1904926.1 type-F conjugative transfer system pilin assembly protein TrbC [Pseudomonadota bacterium]MDP2352049.1 type-F conjugative transfer system pilin assembly protein TrbC [Pseudomonadota bacterium]
MRTPPYHLLAALLLFLSPSQTLAQESPLLGAGKSGIRMPTSEEMAQAQARAREAMQRVPEAGTGMNAYSVPSMPRIEALPKPAAPAPDIASIAAKYRDLGRPTALQQKLPDLLVFVSLSMPREALQRITDQAERAGATLVFRGLKGDSMMKMGEEIKAIVGDSNVSVAIHPPAFQQFSVTHVPVVVLASADASSVLDNGCSKAGTFVKVAGDVSLGYALEYIERHSPAWSDVVRQYSNKITRGID